MLKRRQLGNKNNGQNNAGGGGQPQQRPHQQQQQRHGQKQQNQQQNQQRKNKNQNRNRNQNRRPHRPPPPPAFMQRDVLLIANKEQTKSIEEVRLKFDPLSKKLPAHVTLLFSEPAAKITNDILKKININELPSLQELTFKSIQVVDDMYLWLMPDDESAERLSKWHVLFSQQLNEHTQGEKYMPHITLGYIPRKTPEEEALAFAQNLISTPMTIKFDNLLLEEFSEDQNSRLLDRLQIAGRG